MIFRAAQEYGVDLTRSYMIGDRYGDMVLAQNAGVHSIFVFTGYGLGEYEYQRQNWVVQPAWVAKDLLEAAQIIVRETGKQGLLPIKNDTL
jgi:D-glycero-D-manno-heptose 1,7-bisphosphate phosphatase